MSDKPLIERIEALEQRVADLEEQIDETGVQETAVSGGLDRYDAYVIDKLETDYESDPSAKQIVTLYQETGIRDRSKIKERHKHLKRTGRLAKAVEKK